MLMINMLIMLTIFLDHEQSSTFLSASHNPQFLARLTTDIGYTHLQKLKTQEFLVLLSIVSQFSLEVAQRCSKSVKKSGLDNFKLLFFIRINLTVSTDKAGLGLQGLARFFSPFNQNLYFLYHITCCHSYQKLYLKAYFI